jgi:hypothetical protein
VNISLRRLPGFALAVVALALSASLVFAGQPAGAVAGLTKASTHAGKTVPVQADADQEGADEDTETDADTDESEAPESDSADHCNVDLTQDPAVLMTLNHGSVVCSAAHATEWDTALYPNKGAWVSHWAKMNHGHDPNKQHGHAGG